MSPNLPITHEFVYRDWDGDWDDVIGTYGWHSNAHLIVKKTDRFVYVSTDTTEMYLAKMAGRFGGPNRAHVCRLDRVTLERDGEATRYRDGRYSETYYTTPIEIRHPERTGPRVPECLRALGMRSRHADAAEVHAAYRKMAARIHPDAGGTHEAFIALTNHYQAALARIEGQA